MKSATQQVSLKLTFLVLILTAIAFLIFTSTKIFAASGTPVNISPSTGNLNLLDYPNGIPLSWQPGEKISYYKAIVYSGTFRENTYSKCSDKIDSNKTAYCQDKIFGTTTNIPTNILLPNQQYTWYVNGYDTNGNMVSGSQGTTITTNQPDINSATCEAIYINKTSVPNNGTYQVAPGSTFHADIKLKNTGQKSWKTDQNYKLGFSVLDPKDNDNIWYGINRVELPKDQTTVNPGSEVTFSFDAKTPTTATGLAGFGWQMLREKTANDAGGRFGQICNIIIKLSEGATSESANPTGISNPDPKYAISMITQTACVNNIKNLELVSAKWIPVAGAKSYTATFYEQGGASGFSGCLPANKSNFTFSKQYDATKKYDVSVIAYAGTNCDGGIVNQNKIQVANGFIGALSDQWKYDLINFTLPGQTTPIVFPLNTCAPFNLSLPKPTNTNQEVPVKITVIRSQYDDKLQQTSKALNEPHTVIFKYQPPYEDTNTNDSGNSDSGTGGTSGE